MSSFVFNIAKGRVNAYYDRVESNDPATSALVVVVVKGGETQANMQDADTLTQVLATAADEATGTGWNRKVLTDVELAAIQAPDDTLDRAGSAVPSFNWTPDPAADDSTGVLIGYDSDTGSGTDASIVPLVHIDFTVATDGNQVVVNAGDFFRAT